MPHSSDRPRLLAAAFELPFEGLAMRPVGDARADHVRYLDRDLAVMVENYFSTTLDPDALDEAARAAWWARMDAGWSRPSDNPRETYVRRYWLVDDGVVVGTLGHQKDPGNHLVYLFSLYVTPSARGRRVASRALSLAERSAVAAGYFGIAVPTLWLWQRAVRYYLREGLWVRMWKHDLQFQRCPSFPRMECTFDATEARCSMEVDGAMTEMLRARRDGSVLELEKTEAYAALWRETKYYEIASSLESTFAVRLALEGWPLVRAENVGREVYSDMGSPEALADKIEWWEALGRDAGYVVDTPRIEAMAYRSRAELDDDDGLDDAP